MGMDASHDCFYPFSHSTLKVCEAACVWMRSSMAGMDALRDCSTPFSSNCREAVCVDAEEWDAGVWMSHVTALTHSHPTSRSVSLYLWMRKCGWLAWMRRDRA
jgi:hypothetical protein